MKIDILTLFPEMFSGPFDYSILRRAQDKQLVKIDIHNLRDWAADKYKSVDDRPYGGGAGMILKVDIIDRAVASLKSQASNPKIILLDAGGKKYNEEIEYPQYTRPEEYKDWKVPEILLSGDHKKIEEWKKFRQ